MKGHYHPNEKVGRSVRCVEHVINIWRKGVSEVRLCEHLICAAHLPCVFWGVSSGKECRGDLVLELGNMRPEKRCYLPRPPGLCQSPSLLTPNSGLFLLQLNATHIFELSFPVDFAYSAQWAPAG